LREVRDLKSRNLILEFQVERLTAENAALRREPRFVPGDLDREDKKPARRRVPGVEPAPASDDASERLKAMRERVDDLERRGAPEDVVKSLRREIEATERGDPLRAPKPESPGRGRLLGVVPGPVAPEWAKKHGLKAGIGVRVVEVVPESAAAAAGFQVDDVITGLDGAEVKDADDLKAKVAAAGATALVVYRRGTANLQSEVRFGVLAEPAFKKLYDRALRDAVGDGGFLPVPDSRPSKPKD
jgi:hypothetical protein